ncbi:MAG TPA: hypothetical protein VHY84_00350 [Bryobacteraceae bacterium]|nr:hypothetical protein [Bryobacteraceae bacterium]
MTNRTMIPVWFFAGLLLAIYGVLIFASGVAEWSHPSTTLPATVLGELHAPVWWGALLAVVGAVYIVIYRPRGGR